jgi:hypothetical protein
MNDELRAELLERACRDQAARNSFPPGGRHDKWQEIVAPVDEVNTSWLKGVVAAHGWPGQSLAGEDGVLELWTVRDPARPGRAPRRPGPGTRAGEPGLAASPG